MFCYGLKAITASHIAELILGILLLTSCSSGDSSETSSSSTSSAAAGTTVQVSAAAEDPDGDPLHYRWAATEGTIKNVDAPMTTWVVPNGSGLQFAYVVVSDNKGGYTESRAAALTFTQNQTTIPSTANIPTSAPLGSPGFAWGSVFYRPTSPISFGRNVYLPGVTVTLSNGRSAITDMKGQFFIPNLADNLSGYSATYQIPGNAAVPFSSPVVVNSAASPTLLPTSPSSPNYFLGEVTLPGTLNVAGSVRLADLSFCGIRDEFFTHSTAPNLFTGPISATAQLLTATNNPLSSPFPVNHYGDFLIVRSAVTAGTQAKVRISCESAPVKDSAAITLPASGPAKVAPISLANSRPTISAMKVLLNGQDVGRPDLPKPRTLLGNSNTPPTFSDSSLIAEFVSTPGDDAFLTYKGIDTRISACAYYRAIGAVEGCDPDGFPTGAQLTLDQWRSKFNLSPFSTGGTQEVRIQYINKSDLNLARDMQGVTLANGDVAYNVCNYPGPQDVTDPLGAPKQIGTETQADIDLAIDNARRGIGRVVCVAMDTSVIQGINGGQRFTKFYTFSPTGKLLLSVSLDGRREKFMPGSCTACHGGDAYGYRFPEDGSGRPNIKARWLPFDMANLAFRSSQDPVTATAANNMAIKTLNLGLMGTGLNDRTQKLIAGWYPNGQPDTSPQATFFPNVTGGLDYTTTTNKVLYTGVIQGGCQTCHAAQLLPELTTQTLICTGNPVLESIHTMPNALGPFERFWLNINQASQPSQPSQQSLVPCVAPNNTQPAKQPPL